MIARSTTNKTIATSPSTALPGSPGAICAIHQSANALTRIDRVTSSRHWSWWASTCARYAAAARTGSRPRALSPSSRPTRDATTPNDHSVANAIAGLRVVRKVKAIAGPSCDFRAEQGQWSRRRDARMTTKARLRRPSGADPSVAAPRPKRPDFDAAALGTPRHSSHARQRCYLCLIAIARLRSCGPRAALLLIVVGTSQRLDVLARQRCSLHTKSASA